MIQLSHQMKQRVTIKAKDGQITMLKRLVQDYQLLTDMLEQNTSKTIYLEQFTCNQLKTAFNEHKKNVSNSPKFSQSKLKLTDSELKFDNDELIDLIIVANFLNNDKLLNMATQMAAYYFSRDDQHSGKLFNIFNGKIPTQIIQLMYGWTEYPWMYFTYIDQWNSQISKQVNINNSQFCQLLQSELLASGGPFFKLRQLIQQGSIVVNIPVDGYQPIKITANSIANIMPFDPFANVCHLCRSSDVQYHKIYVLCPSQKLFGNILYECDSESRLIQKIENSIVYFLQAREQQCKQCNAGSFYTSCGSRQQTSRFVKLIQLRPFSKQFIPSTYINLKSEKYNQGRHICGQTFEAYFIQSANLRLTDDLIRKRNTQEIYQVLKQYNTQLIFNEPNIKIYSD